MVTTSIDKLIKTVSKPQTHAYQDAESVLEAAFDEHWTWVCTTLYRLHRRPPKDRGDPDRRALGSWLHRVATNVGLNAIRAKQRRRRYEALAGMVRLQRDAPVDPAREFERRETQASVRRVLAEMKPRAAQVLVLRHSGLSYAEIAAALNVAPGSVGTLLARAEKDFARRWERGEEVRSRE